MAKLDNTHLITSEEEKHEKILQISGAITGLQGVADNLVVSNSDEEVFAVEFLSKVKKYKKRAEEIRKSLVGPLNIHVANINAEFKETTIPLTQFEVKIKSIILSYKKEVADQKAKEQKIKEEEDRKKFADEQKVKLAEAKNRKEKKEIKKEEFVLEEAKEEKETVKTDTGTLSTKKVWKFEIVDVKLVPNNYKVIDEKLIRTVVRNGSREIPGVRIYLDEQINIRAK